MISHFKAGPVQIRVEIDGSDLPSGYAGALIKSSLNQGLVELFKAITLTISNLVKLAQNPKTIDLLTVFISRFGESLNDLNREMAAAYEDVSIGEADAKQLLNQEFDYLEQQEQLRAQAAKNNPFRDYLDDKE